MAYKQYHLTGKEDGIADIARAVGYGGQKFRLDVTDDPIDVRGSWDGGSRNYYHFVHLATMRTVEMPAQSAFDKQIAGADRVVLPPGVVCVEHCIFCGKDLGIRIKARPNDIAPGMLPANVAIADDDKIVLAATAGLKSSYNGIKDLRYHEAYRETGITRERWDAAKASCIASGLLNKAGAITPAGRNAIGDVRLDRLGDGKRMERW